MLIIYMQASFPYLLLQNRPLEELSIRLTQCFLHLWTVEKII